MATFGVELECASPVSHADVADALRAAGVNAVTASYAGRDYSVWQVKADSTIPTSRSHRWQVEVVSPVLSWGDESSLAQLRTVCDVLGRLDARVLRPVGDRSAGLHVHVQMDDLGPAGLARWIRSWAAFQSVTDSLVRSGRESGGAHARWCAVLAPRQINRIAEFAASGDARALSGVADSHGLAVNTQWFAQRGTLEIRQRDGSTNFAKIVGWVAYIMATRAHAESGHVFTGSVGYLDWLVLMGYLSGEHRDWAERRNCGGARTVAEHADGVQVVALDRLARLRQLQGIS